MSNFEKRPPRVEIFIHHHSFGVHPPHFARLPLCFKNIKKLEYKQEHYLAERIIAGFLLKMGQNTANVFFVKQGWLFSGMFLIYLVIVLGGFSWDGPKWAMLFYRLVVPIKDEMLQIREKCGNSLPDKSKFNNRYFVTLYHKILTFYYI